jgi:hypothetical protein
MAADHDRCHGPVSLQLRKTGPGQSDEPLLVLIVSLSCLGSSCGSACRIGFCLLLCRVSFGFCLVLLSLAFPDQVVATAEHACCFLDLALHAFHGAFQAFFQTTLTFAHGVSPLFESSANFGTDAAPNAAGQHRLPCIEHCRTFVATKTFLVAVAAVHTIRLYVGYLASTGLKPFLAQRFTTPNLGYNPQIGVDRHAESAASRIPPHLGTGTAGVDDCQCAEKPLRSGCYH